MTREISQEESNSIKEIAQHRKIKHLVHFTHMSNLPTILTKGLLGQAKLHEMRIPFLSSGRSLRNAPHAISCSITFPNTPMLSKIAGGDKSKWVVLEIAAEVLWTKPCVFCESNAASREIVQSSIENRMGPDALLSMFPDSTFINKRGGWTQSRKKQETPSFFTTDVQAEVLVLDSIEPGLFLKCAHQADIPADMKNIVNSHPLLARKKEFFSQGDFYFKERPDSSRYGEK